MRRHHETISSLRLLPGFRSSERCPQLGGCRPLPRSESSIEGIRILVAEQKCHFRDIHLRPVEVFVRQFLPRLKKQLPEGCAVVDDSTLQGPIAQPELARHGRYLRPASREQAFENPFHLLTDRTLRTALFKRAFELRIQHVKQLGVVGKERPIEIGRVQDERIPSRSERDRALEIGFVEAGRLRAALQLDPFRRHQMPCAAATKFNEGDEGGVCQQRRRFFLRVEPHRLDHALVLAHLDLQFLGRTQLLEASKAGEGIPVVTGIIGRHS